MKTREKSYGFPSTPAPVVIAPGVPGIPPGDTRYQVPRVRAWSIRNFHLLVITIEIVDLPIKSGDVPLSITGWWFQRFGLFSHIVGMMIQSDELIFFKGVAIPPTSLDDSGCHAMRSDQGVKINGSEAVETLWLTGL